MVLLCNLQCCAIRAFVLSFFFLLIRELKIVFFCKTSIRRRRKRMDFVIGSICIQIVSRSRLARELRQIEWWNRNESARNQMLGCNLKLSQLLWVFGRFCQSTIFRQIDFWWRRDIPTIVVDARCFHTTPKISVKQHLKAINYPDNPVTFVFICIYRFM